ncbi:MAG: hypothetical protein ACE5I7_07805 [Candidatus Binatia bacterium]
MQFKRGQLVRVPCQIEPGPLDELLISVDTETGPISGFVQTELVERESETAGYILGRVVEVERDKVKVRLQGSFFTTTGVASLAATNLHLNT